jgi:inosine/xanthosine triphosphate pyrophosphatase family protein
MKSLIHWLSTQDWLNLTQSLTDRRVFLRQILAYQDKQEQMLFSVDIEGVLLKKPRGVSADSNQPIMSFDNEKHSIAEMSASGKSAVAHKQNSWDQFCAWLTNRHI